MPAIPPDADHVRVHFETGGVDARREFHRSYLYDAVERLPATADCEALAFAQSNEAEDRGRTVVIDAYGDVDAILDRERETWDALVADGPLEDWSHPEYETTDRLATAFGEDGWREQEFLRYLASAMTAATRDLADAPPAPVDAYPETDADAVGWHRVLHLLSNQWGYDLDAEADAYVENLSMVATILGKRDGLEEAESFVDDVTAALRATVDELEASGAAGEGFLGDDDGDDGDDSEVDGDAPDGR